ncbi:TPA: carboxypeptidase regulatory-like domain-containing protein, partial [Staphylococcus aureus]|nr:carboxypeptidase regulatory-like domain-containing protein [Staphylococcus aureus]
MNNKKTATNRKGMISNRLNKFSIRKYSVGTASILVGTTLIFGLSGHEAKAAEHTNGELNQSKNETTAPSENKTTEKVDSRQLKDNTQTATADQPKVTMSDSATVKETSSNMQSPQNTTANQSTTQTSNVTTNDKSATTYSNDTSKSNLTQAKDVSTKPKTTTIKPRTLNRMAVNTVAAPQQGTNVNDKVHFKNIDIAIDKGHVNKDTGKTEFWATSSDVLKLKANYTIDDSVKEGDTFTFKYGQYFRPGSVRLPSKTQNLYNAQGNIIAKGIYDSATNSTTYTFTNYVDQYTNISGSIEQVSFAKRENATTDKTAYKMEVTLGNDSYSKEVIVDYGNKKAQPLISSTNYINNEDLSRNMTAYVNQPKNTYTKQTFVTNLTGYKFNPNAKNFKIYEVTNQNQFVDSFTPDTSKLTDVTDQFDINYSNDNKTATVDLMKGQKSSNKQYIIQQVAYPDNSSTDNGKIDYTLDTDKTKYSWSNSYSNVNGSSTANGDQKKYNLGDYVWEDTNKDGKQDANEKGIKGVYVILKDSNGKELDRTTTDENGKYQFTGLSNGTYSVEFSNLPKGYEVTPSKQGNNEELDSNGLSSVITVNGKDNLSADLGIYKPKYNLGDYVWEDTNKNGIQDQDEKGISGVTVTLKDENGNVLKTVTTDADGKYKFTDLDNGNYKVVFTTPEGYTPTTVTSGSDIEKDSNGLTTTGVINGADNMTLDSGFYKTPKYNLGNYVWEDTNKDGKQDSTEKGISGVTVTLKNENGEVLQTTKTDKDGKYQFTGLENGTYKVEFETPSGYTPTQVGSGTDEGIDSNGTSTTGVIKDKDNDTIDSGFYKPTYNLGDYVWEDTNKNGVQDKDEKGISGVTVTLKDENDKVLKTVTTDENGKYQFTDLNNGTYKVEFETPSGYTPTSVTSGNDTEKDSNGLTTTGVIKDADNMTLDSGFYKTPKYSLGDYVWYDSNKDGKQDSTEKGIKDVKVTLLNEKGEVIGTTKTDENGKYRFDNLDSGKYKVIFEKPAGLTQTGTNTT